MKVEGVLGVIKTSNLIIPRAFMVTKYGVYQPAPVSTSPGLPYRLFNSKVGSTFYTISANKVDIYEFKLR